MSDRQEAEDIDGAINAAMKAIADENEELGGALPRNYNRLEKPILRELFKVLNRIRRKNITEDAFGEIDQYFLGNFAQKEGHKGGEFFTPRNYCRGVFWFYLIILIHTQGIEPL